MKALQFPFGVGTNHALSVTTSYDAIIRGQVIDAIMTNQGERAFRGTYGCDIRAALFDPSDNLVRSDAANYIKDRLQAFVPRIIVGEIAFTNEYFSEGLVYIDIKYRPSIVQDERSIRVSVTTEALNQKQGAA